MDTPQISNLRAGTETPFVGIYVVSHLAPSHAVPHEVSIAALMILPKCNLCEDVRFSFRRPATQAIGDNEFFQKVKTPWNHLEAEALSTGAPIMQIFVQPRNGDSFDEAIRRAIEILQNAEILTASAGRSINNRPVVLVDPADFPEALVILDRAGVRAIVN
jgi:hypothetical protein